MTWRPLRPSAAEREPRRLGPSLDRLAAQLGLPSPHLLGAVFTRWSELVGPDVAAHARPVSLRQGTLTVVVDHPAWASSLRLLSAELLSRVAEAAGGEEVSELVIRVEHPGRGRGREARG